MTDYGILETNIPIGASNEKNLYDMTPSYAEYRLHGITYVLKWLRYALISLVSSEPPLYNPVHGSRFTIGSIEARFIEIINDNKALINKICYFYANSTDDFKDLQQDAIINIWKGMSSYNGESKTTTWIYRICLNTCVSTWRKNKKFKSHSPLMHSIDIIDDPTEKDEQMEQLHYWL